MARVLSLIGLRRCMQVKQNSNHPAVFLDRDGVLIENIDGDYVRTLNQITVLPGAKDAVNRLFQGGFLPVIVTNQAAVAKGLISFEQAWNIQRAVESTISPNQKVASMLCPHSETDDCNCRKPKPGMLLQMADEHKINLHQSFLIGDAMTDVAAARAAGITPILVLSGRGAHQYHQAARDELEGLRVFSSIVEAVDYILELRGSDDK